MAYARDTEAAGRSQALRGPPTVPASPSARSSIGAFVVVAGVLVTLAVLPSRPAGDERSKDLR
jgi:hypothetical protein